MNAFTDIIFWGMFVLIGIMCVLVMTMISRLREANDNMEYYQDNSNYFTERNSEVNKEVENLHQDISYYLNRLALYKAFLAEKDMVEAFVHWRPTITVNKKSVPPWEDEMDEAVESVLAIRLPDRSSKA